MSFIFEFIRNLRARSSSKAFGPMPGYVFTEWVSPRRPWQLFELLVEGPYGAMEVVPCRVLRRGGNGQVITGMSRSEDGIFRWFPMGTIKGVRVR